MKIFHLLNARQCALYAHILFIPSNNKLVCIYLIHFRSEQTRVHKVQQVASIKGNK